MNPRFLFPHQFKKIGWMLLLPFLTLGMYLIITDVDSLANQWLSFEIPTKYLLFYDSIFKNEQTAIIDFTDELVMLGLTVALVLIAFSKEKIEDEWVSKIRLESLQWGIYVNTALLLLATFLIHGSAYWIVIIVNMFTPLIIFNLRFHYILYVKPRLERNGERSVA
ncbi:MAG: hypothetical protein U0Y10_14295 [Spirosomataceae bacterium]